MINSLLPAIWLIVILVGLPQLSETVYTPSLPDIAHALNTSDSMVEYTLTLYLFSFAIGTLFWGKVSDKIGRKPCVIAGLLIFILGCIGCYFSNTITMLMTNRFIQAFGGSIGSVLGQAICRDAFHGRALGKVYSSIGAALALFPALGPIIGGVIAENFGWPIIFLFLTLFAIGVLCLVIWRLPETHPIERRKPIAILTVVLSMFKDKKIIGYGLVVAGCNGIGFSYYAEGSFYLINLLGLSPSEYGLSFIAISASYMVSGLLSRKLQNTHASEIIMKYGLIIMLIATSISSFLILWQSFTLYFSEFHLVAITIIAQLITSLGIGMATSNALALALVNYKSCIGTASSLFGFFYYCLISLFTLGMGYLHNGTLLPMPLYFFGISIFMLIAQKFMLPDKANISK